MRRCFFKPRQREEYEKQISGLVPYVSETSSTGLLYAAVPKGSNVFMLLSTEYLVFLNAKTRKFAFGYRFIEKNKKMDMILYGTKLYFQQRQMICLEYVFNSPPLEGLLRAIKILYPLGSSETTFFSVPCFQTQKVPYPINYLQVYDGPVLKKMLPTKRFYITPDFKLYSESNRLVGDAFIPNIETKAMVQNAFLQEEKLLFDCLWVKKKWVPVKKIDIL
jgi:hypothetical protein